MFYEKWLSAYRVDLKFKNYSDNSIEMYCRVVFIFMSDFQNIYTDPKKINTETIKSWLKENSKSISQLKIKIGAQLMIYDFPPNN